MSFIASVFHQNQRPAWPPRCTAMTILPNFLLTGILAVILGLVIIMWAGIFMQHKHSGIVFILLSIVLLLLGGGFFPPVIGIVAGMKTNKPVVAGHASSVLRTASRVWPSPLIIFLVWVSGQFLVGYFFNDFLKSIMGFGMLLILSTLRLSAYTAYAHDVIEQSSQEISWTYYLDFSLPQLVSW